MPKVSVIVPIYNASLTLERCAISLFEQTLDDIEYIFIDDCSTDDSLIVLDEVLSRYPLRHPQTIIVKQTENTGVARVRQRGIEIARGEYLIHCDSDDWPDAQLYEVMYNLAMVEDSDLVISEYKLHVYEKVYYGGQCMPGVDLIKGLLNNRLSSGLWNKMVRKSVVKRTNFVFPAYNMCEDFLITTQYLIYSRRVSFASMACYHYVYNPSSMAHVMTKDSILARHTQIVRNISISIELVRSSFGKEKYRHDILRQQLFVKNVLKPLIADREIYELWKQTFKESNIKILFCRSIPFKERGLYLLCYFRLDRFYHRFKRSLR